MSIEIKNITKYYGKKAALNDVSINLEQGIYGLLGANGAGKSTLLNIITTSLAATNGTVLWNGEDIRNKKSGYLNKLGYMPQTPRFYKNYTAEEFLKYIAALKKVKTGLNEKIDELLEFVNLSDSKKAKIGTFSGGMLQRMGIAQALINDPEVLILDEPTAGLDPKERIRFRNLVSSVSKDRIIILATHIVPDIEYIANRVIILDSGNVVRNENPAELCREIDDCVWSVELDENQAMEMMSTEKVSNVLGENGRYFLRVISKTPPHQTAKQVQPTLEDVFLFHTEVRGE